MTKMNGFHKPSDSANKEKNSLPDTEETNSFPSAQSEYSHVDERTGFWELRATSVNTNKNKFPQFYNCTELKIARNIIA